MKPVSTLTGPPSVSTATVATCPPGARSCSNRVTRWPSRFNAQAAVSPLTPDPTIAMSIASPQASAAIRSSVRCMPSRASRATFANAPPANGAARRISPLSLISAM